MVEAIDLDRRLFAALSSVPCYGSGFLNKTLKGQNPGIPEAEVDDLERVLTVEALQDPTHPIQRQLQVKMAKLLAAARDMKATQDQ